MSFQPPPRCPPATVAMTQAAGSVQGVPIGKVAPERPSLQMAAYTAREPEEGSAVGQDASGTPPELEGVWSGTGQASAQADTRRMSCRDAALPASDRLRFVIKVYGILSGMLVLTGALITPFMFMTQSTVSWFARHIWVFWGALAVLIIQYAVNMLVALQTYHGGGNLPSMYVTMMMTAPFNYIYAFTFATGFGVVMGFVCAKFTAEPVLVIVVLTIVLISALTMFAVFSRADFSGRGAYLVVISLALVLASMFVLFVRGVSVYHYLIAGAVAVMLGLIIVHDTQRMFGSGVQMSCERCWASEYSIDMYVLAAWDLYRRLVHFYVYPLPRLSGCCD